jgi:hypothetical protein
MRFRQVQQTGALFIGQRNGPIGANFKCKRELPLLAALGPFANGLVWPSTGSTIVSSQDSAPQRRGGAKRVYTRVCAGPH